MLNLLEDYISRSLPEYGEFQTNPNLLKKVDRDGNFLPFYGNTVVFLLDDGVKEDLKMLQAQLQDAAGWMLSQPLNPETFHVTLHDLVNGSEKTLSLCQRMEETEQKAKALLAQWANMPPLRMKTTWLFNMVNTSIVLGLAPTDEETALRLDDMYTALESVVPLGYGLTPHITMAYFRPGSYSAAHLQALRNVLCPIELELQLDLDKLVHQRFSDMNHYTTT